MAVATFEFMVAKLSTMQKSGIPGTDKRPGELQPESSEEICNHIYVKCQPISRQIYSDQPGQFLVASTSGHRYLMVAYN
jgi:hypothetical protein